MTSPQNLDLPEPSGPVKISWRPYIMPLSILAAIVLWYAVARLGEYPAFILPTPILVWSRFLRTLADGSLVRHSLITLTEVLLGLFAGLSVAVVLGYILGQIAHA